MYNEQNKCELYGGYLLMASVGRCDHNACMTTWFKGASLEYYLNSSDITKQILGQTYLDWNLDDRNCMLPRCEIIKTFNPRQLKNYVTRSEACQ